MTRKLRSSWRACACYSGIWRTCAHFLMRSKKSLPMARVMLDRSLAIATACARRSTLPTTACSTRLPSCATAWPIGWRSLTTRISATATTKHWKSRQRSCASVGGRCDRLRKSLAFTYREYRGRRGANHLYLLWRQDKADFHARRWRSACGLSVLLLVLLCFLFLF